MQRRHTGGHVPTPTPSPAWIETLMRFGAWVRRSVQRDHSSLYGDWYTRGNFSGYRHIYLTAACAPSRRLRRPRFVTPERALAFLERVLPDTFQLPPTQSSRGVVAFEVAEDDVSPEPLKAGRIYANGRVELFVRAPAEIDSEDVQKVDLLAAMEPLAALVAEVKSGAYRDLYGFRTSLRRLDWYVALSHGMSEEVRGWRVWDDLKFPGRRPLQRATKAYPAAPPFGLAWQKLRNRSPRTDPQVLLNLVLTDLIIESGWDGDVDVAIADTIGALTVGSARFRDEPT